MSRFLGAFRSKAPTSSRSSSARNSISNDSQQHEELDDFLHALQSANHIMNDEIKEAEAALGSRQSSFHLLALSVLSFLKATLGFEEKEMQEARKRLGVAESATSSAYNACVKNGGNGWRSEIYDVGAEYLICHVQSQIMTAIVGVLNESVTESVKGFYKVNKAKGVLAQLADMEKRFLERKGLKENTKVSRPGSSMSQRSKASSINETPSSNPKEIQDLDSDTDSFVDAASDLKQPPNHPPSDPTIDPLTPYITNPIDAFIHAALSTQYGLLLFLVSLIPPAFAPILSILGFRGDRDRGIALLWQASNSEDLQGAIAALPILEVYNGLVSFFDIQGSDAWPGDRLRTLLGTMRTRYPKSALWHKEEARMCSAERDLETSITMLGAGRGPLGDRLPDESDAKPQSALKQVEAIRKFERALDAMYLHAYSIVSETFQKCVDLNNWSHGLYYYIAGCAELELYRIHKFGGYLVSSPLPTDKEEISMSHRAPPSTYTPTPPDPSQAATHAETATALFAKALPASQKKRMLARQLPFDAFITRKLTKWNQTAQSLNLPVVEVIGPSPVEEMQLFWGGHGRMRAETLMESLRRIAFSDGDYSLLPGEQVRPVDPRKGELGADDKATLAVLRATVVRRLGMLARAEGNVEEGDRLVRRAHTHLTSHLSADWRTFKTAAGRYGDTWPLPMGRYELAAQLWTQRHDVKNGEDVVIDDDGRDCSKARLLEIARLLEELSKWESYDLDVRMGLKISTGKATLKKMGIPVGG